MATAAEAFASMDADGSGFLDEAELAGALGVLGLGDLEPEELQQVMVEMDPDGDGKVTLTEFSAWWAVIDGEGGGPAHDAASADAAAEQPGGGLQLPE